MNYRASLITFEDDKGNTHTYPAFKIKGLSGEGILTTVFVEPVEGLHRTIKAKESESKLRERWDAALLAAEV